jgi:hypothetical protein
MKIRPRFSLRTLAIAVALVCVYFGSWESMRHFVNKPFYPTSIPFVEFGPRRLSINVNKSVVESTSQYHAWLFRVTFKLPFYDSYFAKVEPVSANSP